MLAIVVALATLVVAITVGIRLARRTRIWLPHVAQILMAGSVVVTVVATALPREPRLVGDGDLVLVPGRGGLGNLDQILADPTSLAGLLVLANIVLYLPIAFFAVLGYHAYRRLVLAGCLALSVMVEATQYLALGRVATIDDVILNMLGAALGFVLAYQLIAFFPRLQSLIGGEDKEPV